MYKFAEFADERLAQKAHRAVVKQYGLTESDGEKYWKLKSAIYQKMGGKFSHKTASAGWRAGIGAALGAGAGYLTAQPGEDGIRRAIGGAIGGGLAGAATPLLSKAVLGKRGAAKLKAVSTAGLDKTVPAGQAAQNMKNALNDYNAWRNVGNNSTKDLVHTVGAFALPALAGVKGGDMMKSAESFVPPPAVAAAAARGLEYRSKASPSNKGGLSASEAHKQGIGSGVQRAVNLKNRDAVSSDTINRMVSFFARHAGNESVSAENKGTPWNDKGYVAYLLWGGGPGKAWANSIKNKMESKDKPREADKMAAAVGAMKSAGLVDMYGRSPWLTTALVGGAGGALVGAAPGGKGYEQQTGALPRALAGGLAGAVGSSLLHGGFRAFVAKESPMYRRYAPYILGSSAGYGGLWGLAGGNLLEAAHRDRQAKSQENRALKTAAVNYGQLLDAVGKTVRANPSVGAGLAAGNMVSKTSMLHFLLHP